MKTANGAQGFSKDYWDKNYSIPEDMDGIANASLHAKYLKSYFDVDFVDVSSIIDFGFGLGFLFEEILKEFLPYRAGGLEPSKHAFDEVVKRKINPVESTNLKLLNIDLLTWAKKQNKKSKWYDLGICTSVFQYLSDEEIKFILPIMAEQVKYLYFSVPTDIELDRQVDELEFHDEYAIKRSKKKYLKLLEPHFTIISSRILESKVHSGEDDTYFTDLIFRF